MNDEKVKAAHEILQYWIENPQAQDTLEGIVEWWISIRTIKQHRRWVKEALDMLVKEGLVIEHEGRDSRIYYKINIMERDKIISLLQEKP